MPCPEWLSLNRSFFFPFWVNPVLPGPHPVIQHSRAQLSSLWGNSWNHSSVDVPYKGARPSKFHTYYTHRSAIAFTFMNPDLCPFEHPYIHVINLPKIRQPPLKPKHLGTMAPYPQPSHPRADSTQNWIAPDSWNNQPVAISVIVLVVVSFTGTVIVNWYLRKLSEQRKLDEESKGHSSSQMADTRAGSCGQTFQSEPAYPEPAFTGRRNAVVDFAASLPPTTNSQGQMPSEPNQGNTARHDGPSRFSRPVLRLIIPPSKPLLSTPSEVSPFTLPAPEHPLSSNP